MLSRRKKLTKKEKRAKASFRQRTLYANSQDQRDYQKNLKLMKAYGITLEQYKVWNEHNSGLCQICDKPETAKDKKTGRIRMLAVDHDKVSGIVRGLLCSVCNRGIGMLKHDPFVLAEAIDYLNYFNKVTIPGIKSAINS